MLVTVHGPQKHSEKLSRTVQTTNAIVAKNTLVVNHLAPQENQIIMDFLRCGGPRARTSAEHSKAKEPRISLALSVALRYRPAP